jgi:hypothetical protein
MAAVFSAARAHRKILLINRPYAMGELLQERSWQAERTSGGDALHSRARLDGYILSGTRSEAHLDETLRAFETSS